MCFRSAGRFWMRYRRAWCWRVIQNRRDAWQALRSRWRRRGRAWHNGGSMSFSLRQVRALSLLSLLLCALFVAALFGARSAQRFDARGRPDDFPQPVFGAERLHLGVNVDFESAGDATLDRQMAQLSAAGLRAVRHEFRWNMIEPERGSFRWAAADRIFAAARKYNLRVLAVLWTTPAWARGDSGSANAPATETAPPRDLRDFARFAGAFAARYDASVMAYQIWDEPNLSAAWGDALVNPTLYLQLLRAAREAVREINPVAIVALAALAPTVEQSNVNLEPQTFLQKLYQLGGHQAFDIAAAKPYGFEFPPGDRRVDPSLLNFSHVILMREVMVAHGDGHKAIWAAAFGWNALPGDWQGERSIWGAVSEAQQAEYTADAVRRVAREWPWLGAMFIDGLQPRPRESEPELDARWGFALLDQRGKPRPVFDAFAAAGQDAAYSTRAGLFADCRLPQSVARALRLENLLTAMPEIESSQPDCREPNSNATFTEGWRFEQLGADIPERPDAKVSVRFSGEAFALIVRRGNYRAYTFVTIDGQPANLLPREPRGAYLIMTAPALAPQIETIPVASGLGPGEHVAEISVDRGWNQWALIGWSARAAAPDARVAASLRLLPVALLLSALVFGVATWRARWRSWLREQWSSAGSPGQPVPMWRAVLAGLALWVTSSLAWAQDAAQAWHSLSLPVHVTVSGLVSGVLFWSPLLVISLAALAALFVLVLFRLEAGLLLLAFFIPFFLLPQRLFERSFPMVEILTFMCAISWVVQWAGRWLAERGQDRPRLGAAELLRRISALDWGVLGLALVGVLSTSQAAQQVVAWRELRLVILEPALLYLVLRTARLSNAAPRLLLGAFVAGALAIACIGLFNYARGERYLAEFGLPRIKSIFGSANNDALYLARALPFALAALTLGGGRWYSSAPTEYDRRSGLRRAGMVGVCAAIGLALLLSQSRGMLLFGLPAMLVTMLLLAGGRWRMLGLAGLVLAGAGLFALLSGALRPLVEGTRLENVFDLTRGTTFFRMNLWLSAWRMFLDHPFLGVGPDNYLYAYRGFYILPAAWQEPGLSHPHNVVLDWLTRLGVAGFAAGTAMVAGFVALIRRGLRGPNTRVLAIAGAGYLAEVLAHGMVDHSFFLIDLMFVFMLLAGVMGWAVSKER